MNGCVHTHNQHVPSTSRHKKAEVGRELVSRPASAWAFSGVDLALPACASGTFAPRVTIGPGRASSNHPQGIHMISITRGRCVRSLRYMVPGQ